MAFAKGAVDSLLQISDRVWAGDEEIPLTDEMRVRIVAATHSPAMLGIDRTLSGLDLVSDEDIRRIIAMARAKFDYVVIDMPKTVVLWTETVLQAARRHGVAIPALCYLEGLSEWGACRLCVVQVAERLLEPLDRREVAVQFALVGRAEDLHRVAQARGRRRGALRPAGGGRHCRTGPNPVFVRTEPVHHP